MNRLLLVLMITLLAITGCGGRSTVSTRPAAPEPTIEPVSEEVATSPAKMPTVESSPDTQTKAPDSNSTVSQVPPASTDTQRPGGYYMDDGPDANPPKNLDDIPNAYPKKEALSAYGNKPYTAMGTSYTPMKRYSPYKETGIASWYGKRFHGRKTSSGEIYDMYAMTAAHPILPIPSYVKVTNHTNGRSIIARVNDRGPFKKGRLIDLSYSAAHKLGYINKGSTTVTVEALNPEAYPRQQETEEKKLNGFKLAKYSGNPAIDNANNSPQFFVQIGAFKQASNAEILKKKIENLNISANTQMNTFYNGDLYKVRLGPYPTRADADEIAGKLSHQLNTSAIVTTK